MVGAWLYNEQPGVDQREPHQLSPNVAVPLSTLAAVGVVYFRIDPAGCEQNPFKGDLGRIRTERHYRNHDIITISREKLPNYDEKIKMFFEEHIHEDEEIRFVIEGTGYFDVRNDADQQWVRVAVEAGDMLILPAGIYHRFTLDTQNYIKVIRLFQDQPKWEAINRSERAEGTQSRKQYLDFMTHVPEQLSLDQLYVSQSNTKQGPNGESFIMKSGNATSNANYPHMRAVNGMLYVSGTSSRREDNTHVGAELKDGKWQLDIKLQTEAVLKNIARILLQAAATLSQVVEVQVFLVDMNDYAGMNEVYNTFFPDPSLAPVRTTVAVKQLPHPNLLVEMRVVAVDPRVPKY